MQQEQKDRISNRKRKFEGSSKSVATWNVPEYIHLDPTQSLIVGRTSAADIILHSPKHPSMLSRKHARLQYNLTNQLWTITDLEVSFLLTVPQ